jgi:hypothetical protein
LWLSWNLGAVLAACLVGVGLAARWRGGRVWSAVADFSIEASIVAALYSVWQLITTVANTGAVGAMAHGRWVLSVEKELHLPSELSWQRAIVGDRLLVEANNVFYAIVHVPALGVFLVWLFLRHREDYADIRNVLAILTIACFLIHLVPVAPPRLLPGTGFVDTALRYHQSVYGPVGTGISDQVSAMPSVHVAWAALIAWAVIKVGTSPWRWLILLHPAITMVVVVVTANHFWLDGVVAAALIIPSAWLARGGRLVYERARRSRPAARRALVAPAPVAGEPAAGEPSSLAGHI